MDRSTIARATIAGLAMMTVTGCHHKWGGEHHADAAKTADEAKAVIAAVSATYNAHDAAKAASYDSSDYVSMFHGQPNGIGPAADEAAMKQQFTDPATRFDLSIQSVDVARSGEMAVVRTTYRYSYTDPKTKAAASESGNWVAGLKRQPDGSLKLVWSVGADTPAAPAAPAPAASATP